MAKYTIDEGDGRMDYSELATSPRRSDRAPGIPEMLTHVEEEVDALVRTLGDLFAVLDPFLTPDIPPKALTDNEPMPLSAMGNRLMTLRDRVHGATDRTGEIIRRVDVD